MDVKETGFLLVAAAVAMLVGGGVVLVGGVETAEAAFPGQNGRIAFNSIGPDGDWHIYTSRPDGSGLRRVTAGPGTYPGRNFAPEWSPDGTKIAFTSDRDGDEEIYVKDMTSGKVTQLTHNVPDPEAENPAADADPAWSPDGSRIVFYSSVHFCCGSLWVINSDGSNLRRLSQGDLGGPTPIDPTWSPDGSKIAFANNPQGWDGFFDIWVINSDGSDLRNLTDTPELDDRTPDWSPNGRKIAWAKQPRADAPTDIWKMNASDGSGRKNLTPDTPRRNYDAPAWSPDGGKIAYIREGQSGDTDVWKMNALDGSNKTNITNTSAYYERDPDWQPKPTL
jgi:TolB protein